MVRTSTRASKHFVPPRWIPWAVGFVGVVLLTSIALYGLSVWLESRVLSMGEQTSVLKEENQDLQLHLNRLKSYHKVAQVSEKLQGLSIAQDVVSVPNPNKSKAVLDSLKQPPVKPIPEGLYGY